MHPSAPDQNATLSIRELLGAKSSQTELNGAYTFDDMASLGPIHCHWRIHRGDIGIALRGDVTGMMQGECARCLSPFELPVCLTLNEKLVFRQYAGDASDYDNFCDVIDTDSVVDLADLTRQYLIMELSGHPHCQQAACACPAV